MLMLIGGLVMGLPITILTVALLVFFESRNYEIMYAFLILLIMHSVFLFLGSENIVLGSMGHAISILIAGGPFVGLSCLTSSAGLGEYYFNPLVLFPLIVYYLILANINSRLKPGKNTLKSRILSKWPIILIQLLFLGVFGFIFSFGCCT